LCGISSVPRSSLLKIEPQAQSAVFTQNRFPNSLRDQPPPFRGRHTECCQNIPFFSKNKGEHIKMKFEASHLRSCTDEDNDKNAMHRKRTVTPYRQGSRPLTSCGRNTIRTCRYGPLLHRSNTAIGEVYQMKERSSLSTALAVSTSSAYTCSHSAERRGFT